MFHFENLCDSRRDRALLPKETRASGLIGAPKQPNAEREATRSRRQGRLDLYAYKKHAGNARGDGGVWLIR